MGRSIVVTSGKGGVGKTVLSANVGVALSRLGHRTLLIDSDIGLRNLDVLLGMEDRMVYDLADVCVGGCDLQKAVIKDKKHDNLYFLPAPQTKSKDCITVLQMKNLIKKAKEEYEYIIIDSPGGIERGFENAVAGADCAIVVTLPEKTAVRDADRVIGILEDKGIEDIKVAVNRVRIGGKSRWQMSAEEVLDILSVELIGIIPEDDKVLELLNMSSACVDNDKSAAGNAYRNIARRLTGEKTEPEYIGKTSIFTKIIEAIRG